MARPTLEKAKQQAQDLKTGMDYEAWLKKWNLSKQGAWAKTSRLKKIGLLPSNFTTRGITKLKPVGKSTVASMIRGVEKVGKVKEGQRGQRVKEGQKGQRVKEGQKGQRVKEGQEEQRGKRVRLVLPADLWKQVSKAAIDQEVSKVDLVKEALKKYLKP